MFERWKFCIWAALLGGGLAVAMQDNGSADTNSAVITAATIVVAQVDAEPRNARDGGAGYEASLNALARKLVLQLQSAGQKSATVLDFTDLQGQGTELGRFLAQELSDQLVAGAKTLSLVDRANLQYLLRENKLSIEGLVDPQSTRKLGNLIGIDTIIMGTVTPLGTSVRLSVRAVAVETGKIVASQSTTVPAVGGLGEMYTRGLASKSPGSTPDNPPPDVRGRFRSDSIKVVGKYVTYTKWLDGTQNCWNGAVCATAAFVIENLSGVGFNAAIKAGSTSIGSCVGHETEAAGLKIYDNNPGWSNNVRLDSAQRFIPPNAKVTVTIKVENCSAPGMRTVDVTVALSVSIDGRTFEIPLSASNVPVQ